VMAAARGKDFVLIGPPGTGKSQTIANLIAQCLAEGKRVLFLAEKIAALDVVYRRLREVGLGEFCLELHSSKTRKLDVLSQLQKSWESRGEVDPADWAAKADQLSRLREQISAYVARLHQRHRNGMTIYKAIGLVVGGEGFPDLRLSWPSARARRSRVGRAPASQCGGGRAAEPARRAAARTLRYVSAQFTQAACARRWPSTFPSPHRQAPPSLGLLAKLLPQAAGQSIEPDTRRK
jgi:hypothetical protein